MLQIFVNLASLGVVFYLQSGRYRPPGGRNIEINHLALCWLTKQRHTRVYLSPNTAPSESDSLCIHRFATPGWCVWLFVVCRWAPKLPDWALGGGKYLQLLTCFLFALLLLCTVGFLGLFITNEWTIFIQISYNFIPIDSPWIALFNVFWCQFDTTNRSAAK